MNEHGALVDDTDREEPKYSEKERSVPVPFYPSQIAHVTEPGPPLTDRRRHLLVSSCGCENVRWILFRRQKLRFGALRLCATNRLCYDV